MIRSALVCARKSESADSSSYKSDNGAALLFLERRARSFVRSHTNNTEFDSNHRLILTVNIRRGQIERVYIYARSISPWVRVERYGRG